MPMLAVTLVQLPAAVARQLDVAVVGSDPDLARCPRAFRDRIDRRVHLGRAELSTVIPPDCSCRWRIGSLVDRSGEMRSQVTPWSRLRNRNCEPM